MSEDRGPDEPSATTTPSTSHPIHMTASESPAVHDRARGLLTPTIRGRIERYGTDAVKALLESWDIYDQQ
jgi:hypothetical protein